MTNPLTDTLTERRRERIDRMYRELRASDRDLFDRCVRAAETVLANNYRALGKLTGAERLRLGADIEESLVYIACETTP
jgi:phage-related baseplate assembly protein